MKFKKGDLVFLPKYKQYPEDYLLVLGASGIDNEYLAIYDLFSLTQNRKDTYTMSWFEDNAIKVQ
jgi:hypothetical protein